MIADKDTNTIYFSHLLKSDPRSIDTCKAIEHILASIGQTPLFLEHTNDIWARDYMPIQVTDDKFIEYRFDPDYLQGVKKQNREIKSYPDIICESLNLKTLKTNIILDGGNIVKHQNAVILTDKVLIENRFSYSKEELIKSLKTLFEVDTIVLIPWDKEEQYGHADGMVRFIDDKNVLTQDYYLNGSTYIRNKYVRPLEEAGLECHSIKFNVQDPPKNTWAFMNFLQTRDVILLPKLGKVEDQQALERMEQLFPEYKKANRIFQIPMLNVVESDGALNCISWTIRKSN